MSLFNELKRRNVFRVAIAYLAAAWLLTEVASTLFPLFGVPDWGTRFVVIIFAIGFVPTLIFSWVYELTPEGLRRDENVARSTAVGNRAARRLDLLTIAMVIVALGFIVADRVWLAPILEQRPAAPVNVLAESPTPPEAGTTHSATPNKSIGVPLITSENLIVRFY